MGGVVRCRPNAFRRHPPTTYSAYTGTDIKQIPQAPALGPANSVIQDPTFGSRILRVTDAHTNSGGSFIPEYGGYFRTWNANSTALKLHGPHGTSYWSEFESSSFSVGDGSARPTLHPLNFDVKWEWSAVDPDIIYFKNGNQLAKYNKATQEVTNLGQPQAFRSAIMPWLSAQTLGSVRRRDQEVRIPIHRFTVSIPMIPRRANSLMS